MNTTTQTPQPAETKVSYWQRRLKLAQAERDVAKRYLQSAEANLQQRNAEVDSLKAELSALKKELAVLAQ